MPFGFSAAAYAAAATVATTAYSAYSSSKAQKKAAKNQAQGIENAQGISAEAAKKARHDALSLYGPAMGDLATGFDGAREALLSGRSSIQDILNQTTMNAGSMLQTGAQQYQSALMGNAPQQSLFGSPQPQYQPQQPQVNQPQPTAAVAKPIKPSALLKSIQNSGSSKLAQLNQSINNNDPSAPPPPDQQNMPQKLAPKSRMAQEFGPPGAPRPIDVGISPSQKLGDIPNRPNRPDNQYSDLRYNDDGWNEFKGKANVQSPTPSTPLPLDQNPIYDPITPSITPQDVPVAKVGSIDQGLPQLPQGQYGLGGFENIIGEGMRASEGALNQGLGAGLAALNKGISQGVGAISGQLNQGVERVEQGLKTGRGDITTGRDAATARFNPYAETGEKALQREAALSGALGAEAQQRAFESYNQSPGQQWQEQQAEKALMRNQAATGGLGGGQILKELQEQASGLASQNYQRDLDNLRSLAGRGQQAAGSQAGYDFGAGQALAGLEQGAASDILRGRLQAGGQMGSLYGQGGQAALGANMQHGGALANLYGSSSGKIGQARLGVGQQLAGNQSNLAQKLAQLQTGLGSNLANQESSFYNNLANLSTQQGGQTAGMRTNLAALLANLATGQGSQQANLAQQMGNAQAGGVTNPWGNAASSLAGMYAGGAFNGMGSSFGGGSSPGGAISDYTGSAYSNWAGG